MGSIAGEVRPGLIYLHKNTNQQFTESLSKTDHKTPDTFLNELIDLFVTSNDQSQALQVSSNLAFKFLAVLSGTAFENSNDLMKHLLNLYTQSQAAKTKNTQNIPQERSSNRKRKSQPRRNVKQTVSNGEDSNAVLDVLDEDWTEKSDPRADLDRSSSFDLSVVKQEQPEEVEDGNTDSKDDEDVLPHDDSMEGSEDGVPEITNFESQAATRNRSSRQQPLKGNKSAKDNTVTPQRKSKRRRKEAEWMNELKVKRKASTRPGKTETESHRKADPSKVKMKIVNVKSLQPKGEDPDFEVAKSLCGAHSCQECKMRFKTKVAFNLHRHKAHGYMKGSETMCKLCGKQANFAYRLEVHKLYMCRQIVRNYECDVCKLKFKTVTERAKHPCTKIPRRPFYCTQKNCPFKARKITILIEHLSRHFGVKSYLCGTCGNPFTSKKELDNHMDIHKASKDWMCQECGKSYKCKHSLLAHLRKHRNKGRYKCELCPYTSPVYDGYKQHMLRHREPGFKCEVCGLSLKRAINLRVHMEKKHNPSRIFACKHCDYTTNKGQGFASHMRRHKNVGQNSENDEAYTTGDEPISTDHAMLEQGTSTQGFASPTTYFSISNLPPPVTTTPPLRGSGNTLPTSDCSLNQSILGDPSLIYDGEVNISGTNADTMMGNIVSTATSQDIGMITSDSPGTSLNLYSTESINNGPTSIALPNLILSESITSMNAEETWTACEQTSLNG